jgi:hypothetical protein
VVYFVFFNKIYLVIQIWRTKCSHIIWGTRYINDQTRLFDHTDQCHHILQLRMVLGEFDENLQTFCVFKR